MDALVVNGDDGGHRFGNFPNYYAFHPPKNRLDVLTRSGILDAISSGLSAKKQRRRAMTTTKRKKKSDDCDGDADGRCNGGAEGCGSGPAAPLLAHDDDIDDDAPNRKKRLKIENESKASRPNDDDASSSAATAESKRCADDDDDDDDGVRDDDPWCLRYCDLGCNGGDLTVAVARALVGRVTTAATATTDTSTSATTARGVDVPPRTTMECLGLDLDPVLIERASRKFAQREGGAATCGESGCGDGDDDRNGDGADASTFSSDRIKFTFQVCDLCRDSDHGEACDSFLRSTRRDTGTDRHRKGEGGHGGFDLTTVFSTTMWIHVHGGDDGLSRFLEQVCDQTETYLLVEPQPPGCYRKANTRLRKMGRPELGDVSSSRLKMRPDIEDEIERAVLRCGFRRACIDRTSDGSASCRAFERGASENDGTEADTTVVGKKMNSGEEPKDVETTPNTTTTTAWNRTLRLYERIEG